MGNVIYIVDDEQNIRRLASLALRDANYETYEFSNGNELLKAIEKEIPSLIILDWMMPEPDGMEICAKLRADNKTKYIPIMMLTARGEEMDKVLGLEMGADDYLTKPFGVKELCARVKALLRRKDFITKKDIDLDKEIERKDIKINPPKRAVTKGGQPVDLTTKEFEILLLLMRHPNLVMTREKIMENVWDVDYFGDARTVDVHIRYLRQKLEDNPEKPEIIKTVRGVGYKFCSK